MLLLTGKIKILCEEAIELNSFGDRLFSKSGAGSFYAIGLKNKGIGIAVKVED